MSDLRELYQEVIVDHSRHPRNFHALTGANRQADGHNPLCGDQLHLYLKIEKGVIQEASFEGSGCAISTASASLLTEFLQGKTEAEAHAMFQCFHHAMMTDVCELDPALGKLLVLMGVKEFPARVKCATLAWHTLESALKNNHVIANTESENE